MSYKSRSKCRQRQILPCGICPLMFNCPYDEELKLKRINNE